MIIRLDFLGIFKRHHIDGARLRHSFQHLVDALRYAYDPLTSPPVLHCNRYGIYGRREVAKNQLKPMDIYNTSWVLQEPAYREHFIQCCRARVQLTNTWNWELRKELKKTMRNGPLKVSTIKSTLRWMIQVSPPWWVLASLSVM